MNSVLYQTQKVVADFDGQDFVVKLTYFPNAYREPTFLVLGDAHALVSFLKANDLQFFDFSNHLSENTDAFDAFVKAATVVGLEW